MLMVTKEREREIVEKKKETVKTLF